jgi:hypothetical protein
MQYPAAFSFSSVYSLGFAFLAGLRLLLLRQFLAFFASSAPPPWHHAFSRLAPVVKMDNHALPLRIGQCVALLCHKKPSKMRSYLNTASISKHIQLPWKFFKLCSIKSTSYD